MKKLLFRLSLIVVLASLGVAFAKESLICRLSAGVKAADIAAKYQIQLQDSTPGAPFALFSNGGDAVVSQMKKDPAILWVEDDCEVESPESQSKGGATKGGGLPAVGDRKGLQTFNKNLLKQINWSPSIASSTGRDVLIAILDTGLAPKQTQLWAKVDASMNAIEPGQPAYDIPHNTDSNGNGIPDEAVGHGTMIAGIVDQIAPQVRFVVARIADSDGSATGWNVIKGLAFAVTSHAEVANISLGTLSDVPVLGAVMDWCTENNLLVVAPIGNNSVNAACFPARFSDAVCVGGLDAIYRKATFSNWDEDCAVSGPAVGFASQYWDGQLAIWSGTSFASPVVAASVAEALRHTRPTTPNSLKSALVKTGSQIPWLNPHYHRELGVLVNFTNLVQSFNSTPVPESPSGPSYDVPNKTKR